MDVVPESAGFDGPNVSAALPYFNAMMHQRVANFEAANIIASKQEQAHKDFMAVREKYQSMR